MMHKNRFARSITLGIIFLSLITAGCAAKKAAWGDLKSGLILKYQLPRDKALTYKISINTASNTEAMGQSINSTIKSDTSYSIKGTGVDDQNNLMLQITINDINIVMNNPQGTTSPDTSSLKGKSFGAVHSPDGKQLKTTGTENLPKIALAAGAEQNVKDSFQGILRRLPDTPIKNGEPWTIPVDSNIQQGQIKITIKGESTNVFEGFETIKGMECVKIKSQSKTRMEGSGSQMGQAINLKGDVTATTTWYFAYKKGILVKSASDVNEDIKINLGSMEIPQKATGKVELELVI